jgi:hypothetical protein
VRDLERYEPPDATTFAFLLQMIVGPRDGPGEESFDVQVVTPRWLEARHADEGLASGEHRLIVFDYDWPRIERFLRERVAASAGRDWDEVGRKLGRFAQWEFEDYDDR